MTIQENLSKIRENIPPHVKLIGVSKFHGVKTVMEAYDAGERHFAESRVQEFVEKHPNLPEDIHWHFIGHLQRNKIKFIIEDVDLIHGVDSIRLLKAINQQAEKVNRVVPVLLQVHIADEKTKFGFLEEDLIDFLSGEEFKQIKNVQISGLMGMATYTDDKEQVRTEFRILKQLFDKVKNEFFNDENSFCELSMGMSDDYQIAIEEGSTMVRIGTAIFGEREY